MGQSTVGTQVFAMENWQQRPKLSQGQYGLGGPAVKRKYADCTIATVQLGCVDSALTRSKCGPVL